MKTQLKENFGKSRFTREVFACFSKISDAFQNVKMFSLHVILKFACIQKFTLCWLYAKLQIFLFSLSKSPSTVRHKNVPAVNLREKNLSKCYVCTREI